MSLLKFNISWNEDNAIFRDVEVLTNQSFYDLHTCIKKNFQLPETQAVHLETRLVQLDTAIAMELWQVVHEKNYL